MHYVLMNGVVLGLGAPRFARRRCSPGFTLLARGARVRRHARSRAQCHRAQDHQRPRAYVPQENHTPAEGPRTRTAAAAAAASEQRRIRRDPRVRRPSAST